MNKKDKNKHLKGADTMEKEFNLGWWLVLSILVEYNFYINLDE